MSGQTPGIGGLDRKKMEEERLERLNKKRAAENVTEPPAKAVKRDVDEASQKPAVSSQRTLSTETKTNMTGEERKKTENAGGKLEFPRGTLKQTWAFGHQRHNDIKIEEVLQKSELNTAVISSFNWDFDWFVTKFDAKTKFVLVLQARNDGEKQRFHQDFEGLSRVRLCFPPMSGSAFASMHSKLMLLFYPQSLRVVVPSANFVPYDWGESGIMENSVFLIDLPRLPEERQGHANDTLNAFSKELLRFADAMTLDEDVKLGVLNFDFSLAQDIYFVHTIGGIHFGKAATYTGLPGLSRAVRSLGLQTPAGSPLQVDMAASSVASINNDTIDRVYSAVHGHEQKKTTSTKRKFEDYVASASVKSARDFRIIFPSRETVMQSTGGPENGGTIFLKPDYYKRPQFPSSLIRDYKSRRRGLLSHNKLIYARSPSNAFLYMGSANLSHAAWGQLVYDKGSGGPKLTVNNWECGVLVPVVRGGERVGLAASEGGGGVGESTAHPAGQSAEMEGDGVDAKPALDVLPMDVFESIFGAPWEVPAPAYAEGQMPWNAGG